MVTCQFQGDTRYVNDPGKFWSPSWLATGSWINDKSSVYHCSGLCNACDQNCIREKFATQDTRCMRFYLWGPDKHCYFSPWTTATGDLSTQTSNSGHASTYTVIPECGKGYTGIFPDCTPCAMGTYKETMGSGECTACHTNSISPANSTCVSACLCHAGYTGALRIFLKRGCSGSRQYGITWESTGIKVMCCNEDGKGICSLWDNQLKKMVCFNNGLVTNHSTANSVCQSSNLRLCRISDILDTCGTGCSLDSQDVWGDFVND